MIVPSQPSVALILGPPKSGKTKAALRLLPDSPSTLIVSTQARPGDFVRKVFLPARKAYDRDLAGAGRSAVRYVFGAGRMKVVDPAELADRIQRHARYDVVFIDDALHGFASERDLGPVLSWLSRLAQRWGATVIAEATVHSVAEQARWLATLDRELGPCAVASTERLSNTIVPLLLVMFESPDRTRFGSGGGRTAQKRANKPVPGSL